MTTRSARSLRNRVDDDDDDYSNTNAAAAASSSSRSASPLRGNARKVARRIALVTHTFENNDVVVGDDEADSDSGIGRSPRAQRKRKSLLSQTNGSVDDVADTPRPIRGRKSNAAGAPKEPSTSALRKGKAKAKVFDKASAAATSSFVEGNGDDEETRKKRERQERELMERWAEEYYEIIEQLPLELQRSYTLMRELETKFQARIQTIARLSKEYREARRTFEHLSAADKQAEQSAQRLGGQDVEQSEMYDGENGTASDADAEGEDDAEVFQVLSGEAFDADKHGPMGAGSSSEPANGLRPLTTSSAFAATTKVEPPLRMARLQLLSGIAQASTEALRIADEKVGLAVSGYDWVDRQIRRLDADLQKSENSLLLGLRAGTEASRGLQDALGLNYDGGVEGGAQRLDDVERLLTGRSNGESATTQRNTARKSTGGGRRKKGVVEEEKEEADLVSTDMAIDPNEPTYCYCDQVSYGDMVACDNEDCPREWYHYPCIGFTNPPKGRWFCLFCAPPGYKGSGTFPSDAPCLPPGIAQGVKSTTYNGHGSRIKGGGGQKRKK